MEPINRKLLKTNAKVALKNNFWMIMLVVLVGSFLGVGWNGLQRTQGSVNFNNFNNSRYSSRSSSSYTTGTDISVDDVEAESVKYLLEGLEQMINLAGDNNFHYEYNMSRSVNDNFDAFYHEFLDYFHMTEEEFVQKVMIGIGILLLLIVIINILSLCLQFVIGSFVYAPIGVGYRRFFMRNRKREAAFMDLFSSFNKENYMRIVKTMFSTNIRIFGWSLLFYFPGLVKLYQYYFVNWIMAENPTISKERAREISTIMSDGHKWQIFVLELSFIGWYCLFILAEIVLALVSCGLLALPGLVLVLPISGYVITTIAELYAERREWAIVSGNATNEELKGF